MKLTKQEYESLVDSRFVDVERQVEEFKNYRPIVSHSDNLSAIDSIISLAEKLRDAYEQMVDAEEQEQIDEHEEYSIDMTAGLDKALNIRGKNES